ncbi:MotA/TolQ/ExbB proton channel family protein [Sulfurimonas marina]|uniref:Flagellar motor protein MotA n=1 Tax=Sulfurimonas marina TaxID=2590551 RepID=A0A7M1AXE5_9BACT|nr:MotA/TolQ/ExbB proton channel family protein [Sulfurimonas marina]QOP41996.1 flagellar motor protein MotA [Sulfurimonas marina]
MKFLPLLFLLLLNTLHADELLDAYKKEYAFLKAEKNELQKRLKSEQTSQQKELSKTKAKVNQLQNSLVSLSNNSDELNKQIEKSSQMLEDKKSNKEISSSVVLQAKSLLNEYNIAVDDSKDANVLAVMTKAFNDTAKLYNKLSSVEKTEGKFYLTDGTTTQGTIIKVGNVAAYGITNSVAGALAPAGNGEYKIWNENASEDAAAFNNNNKIRKNTKVFIYENLDKDVEYKKEKTLEETIEGGGTIGYIILALGVLGLLLIVVRVILLFNAGSNVKKITSIVVEKVETSDAQSALEAIKSFKGATARVIKATLRNINKERDHIEDIVTENILNESSNIDKFGSFVLVLAAVAPLLGLLGTVTGMIATFDIITEHGTGDPKLLSGGISEALVTTMLGLVVAIPLLLLGNLVSGWAQSIKDSMEHSALHIVNIFENKKAR